MAEYYAYMIQACFLPDQAQRRRRGGYGGPRTPYGWRHAGSDAG
jgi:hypothetical protein